MSLLKRIVILGVMLMGGLGFLMLFSMDVIKIDWVSFMEIQPSFRPMEDPLPLPERSVPVEGAAYIPGMGAPVNPVPADQVSIDRGRQLFAVNCTQCHGTGAKGDGIIAAFIVNPPADLTSPAVQTKSDGTLFMTISNGVPGKMPALHENLFVRDRWDIVNYLRTLAAQ